VIHEIFPVGILQCNCSVLGDEVSREAMVVDPGDDIDRVLAILERHGLRLTMIVITHAHIDHIGGAAKLRAATGAPVYMHAEDKMLSDRLDLQAAWLGVATPEDPGIDTEAREGDVLRVGAAEWQVLHTPGHTRGSLCLWDPAGGKLIAGDTLFYGSVGRTDLPGGDGAALLRSIRAKLLVLPDETVVIPGHGRETTIGRERRENVFLG
jgi:hydroxyacylglutathione hydrolase